DNSVSIIEAVARFEELIGKKLTVQYVDQNRIGDHICYISDLRRLKADYPGWGLTKSLEDILRELAAPPEGGGRCRGVAPAAPTTSSGVSAAPPRKRALERQQASQGRVHRTRVGKPPSELRIKDSQEC